jgi:hypothetical protein
MIWIQKSVNLPLSFNTLAVLGLTPATGAASPAIDVNQFCQLRVSCVCVAGGSRSAVW